MAKTGNRFEWGVAPASDNPLMGSEYFRLSVNKVQVGESDKQNGIQDNVEN